MTPLTVPREPAFAQSSSPPASLSWLLDEWLDESLLDEWLSESLSLSWLLDLWLLDEWLSESWLECEMAFSIAELKLDELWLEPLSESLLECSLERLPESLLDLLELDLCELEDPLSESPELLPPEYSEISLSIDDDERYFDEPLSESLLDRREPDDELESDSEP